MDRQEDTKEHSPPQRAVNLSYAIKCNDTLSATHYTHYEDF